MTENIQNKHGDDQGVNPIAAGVAGAVIGAGAAVAGVVALKDKKNREKVQGVLNGVKDMAMGYMENIQSKAKDKQANMKGKLTEGKNGLKKISASAKSSLHHGVNDIKKRKS